MKHSTGKTIVTTACIGMAVGTAAWMMSGNHKSKTTKKLKKNTGKALRQMGDMIDNVSYMMR